MPGSPSGRSPRCPSCGTPADAVQVGPFFLSPGAAAELRANLGVVRRELGLPTDDDALAAAVREVALRLNLG